MSSLPLMPLCKKKEKKKHKMNRSVQIFFKGCDFCHCCMFLNCESVYESMIVYLELCRSGRLVSDSVAASAGWGIAGGSAEHQCQSVQLHWWFISVEHDHPHHQHHPYHCPQHRLHHLKEHSGHTNILLHAASAGGWGGSWSRSSQWYRGACIF